MVTDFPEVLKNDPRLVGVNFIKDNLDERHIQAITRIHLHLRKSVLDVGECVCKFHTHMRKTGKKMATIDCEPKCGTWWAFHFLSECLKYIKSNTNQLAREPRLLFKQCHTAKGRRGLYNEAMKVINASQQGTLEVIPYTAGGKWDRRFRTLDHRYPLESESTAQVPKLFHFLNMCILNMNIF